MMMPGAPHGNSDMRASAPSRDPVQSGCREFHEMLDDKLMDIRNWAVEEHHERLKMLQTQNNILRSLLASRSKPLLASHTPPSPSRGLHAHASGRFNEPGDDYACEVEEHHERLKVLQTQNNILRSLLASQAKPLLASHTPPSQSRGLRAHASAGFNETGDDCACEELLASRMVKIQVQPCLKANETAKQDSLERWHEIVQKMILPAWRMMGFPLGHFWVLKESWLAAKRSRAEQGDTQNSSRLIDENKLVITVFEELEHQPVGPSKRSQSRASVAGEGPVKLFAVQLIWNMLRLLLVLYDTIMIPVLTFFSDDFEFATSMSWISRIFWTLDLGLKLMFSYGSTGNIICCRPSRQYLKGWFGLDFTIILSDWLLLLSETLQSSPGAFLRVARLGELLRISRLIEVLVLIRRRVHKNDEIDHDEHMITVYLLEACFAFAIVIHLGACVWYGVGNATTDGWAQEPLLESSRVVHKYLFSLGWAASQIHGTRVSDSLSLNTVELAFSAFSMFVGFILFLFFIGRVTNAEAVRFRIRQNAEREICAHFCNENPISSDLRFRALRYFRNKDKRHRLIRHIRNKEDFLSLLPKSLRMDVKEQILGRFCTNIEFIRALVSVKLTMLRQVCENAVSVVPCFTDDVIFAEGDICSSVYIVQTGAFCYRLGRHFKGGTYKMVATGTEKSESLQNQHYRKLDEGYPLAEAVLWTSWIHTGKLFARSEGTVLALKPQEVSQLVLERKDTTIVACHYATRFVAQLNAAVIKSDIFRYRVARDTEWRKLEEDGGSEGHFAFLSHFKAEAGTEATLMHSELNQIILGQASHPANKLQSPIFLDSSDLNDLKQLRAHVEKSQNLILLLTPGLLSRPWCVLEICVAVLNQRCIIPVELQRPGLPAFDYPREEFYQKLRRGALLSREGIQLLKKEGFDLSAVEAAIRRVFSFIALPFSPHKSHAVRQAELSDIFARCIFY